MHVPPWLNVALEGGALELQSALAEYRALRRLVAGSWEARAPAVADACARLQRREHVVDESLARARRRIAVEPGATAVLPLVREVEAERARLLAALGEGRTLMDQLMRLEERARDVSWFNDGLRRFAAERRFFLAVGAVTIGLVPFTSWLVASSFGRVPTLVNPAAIDDSPLIAAPLLLLAVLVAGFWSRLATWTWVGVRTPSAVVPVGLGLFSILGCAAARLPFGAGVVLALLAVLVTALLLLASHALRPELSVLASLEVAQPARQAAPSPLPGAPGS